MISKTTVIRLSANNEKEQLHNTPLFPCSAYYSDLQTGGIEVIPWHWHKELELMYIVSGSVNVVYGAERATLKPGDGFFCNSRVLHKYNLVSEKCRICYLVFDENLISGGMGTIFYQKYVHPIVTAETFPGKHLSKDIIKDREAIEGIKAAFLASQREQAGFEHDIRYYLGKVLVILGQQSHLPMTRHITLPMERVKEMVDYIHMHYGEPISTDQLAFHAGISEREAQRCFQKVFKMSPRQYIHNYRLQVAEEMLLETSESILAIGLACGFSNPSHFSKSFRAYRGCTPYAFRHRNQ